tara:strand:+ start:988 stop:1197 length:210 start_codon:yes stop_codon:yes gene_type:complete
MNDKVQSNREEIIEIHGELKLIKQEIKNIKENHLSHLDYKISQIQKILWIVFAGVAANLIHVIKTMMVN